VEVIDDTAGTAVVDGALLTGKTYTIKGDGNTATTLGVAIDTAGTYDFSGLVLDNTLTDGIGGLAVTGNAGNDTIVGTSGNDAITSGGGTDLITGGKGKDALTGNAGGVDTFIFAAGDSGTTTATADTLATFTSATDKLDFNIAAGSAVNFGTADADHADIAAAKTAADALMDGTVRYVHATDSGLAGDNGSDFLFVDMDADGASDLAIDLGADSTLVFGDIIATVMYSGRVTHRSGRGFESGKQTSLTRRMGCRESRQMLGVGLSGLRAMRGNRPFMPDFRTRSVGHFNTKQYEGKFSIELRFDQIVAHIRTIFIILPHCHTEGRCMTGPD
jgi:hypothetical protein